MRLWIEPAALEEIKNLPGSIRQRIRRSVSSLARESRPSNSRELAPPEGSPPFQLELRRLRIEDWRVVYVIDGDWQLVTVLAVRKRPPYTYEDLAELLSDF